MTAGNSQKTPLQWRLNQFAEQKSADAVMLLTKAVPCAVSAIVSSEIVTVQYQLNSVFTLPQVTMPVATSQYVRLPIQIGDKGFAVPADYYLGGMSGLGGGIADLTQPGNLSAQVFLPIGNTTWSAVDNNALTLNGPNGVVIRDTAGHTVITLLPDGTVTIDGDLHVTGKVFAGFGGGDQVGLQTHTHGGVQSGSSNTDVPTAGT